MLRSAIAATYGGCVGGVCAAAVASVLRLEPLALWIVGLYLVGSSALIGWVFARISSLSTQDLVLTIPFAPLLVVYMVLMMGVVALFMLALLGCSPVLIVLGIRENRRFLARMKAVGRVLTREELLPRLESGDGTLIAKFHAKGFQSLWWTSDDLAELGFPCIRFEALVDDYPDIVLDAREDGNESTQRLEEEYLDLDSGKAAFLPWGLRWWERLARDYPESRLVIVPWLHGAGPADGSAEGNSDGDG